MREIRKSGSEGGAGQNNVPFLPLSFAFASHTLSSHFRISEVRLCSAKEGGMAVSAVWKLACLLARALPIGTKEHAEAQKAGRLCPSPKIQKQGAFGMSWSFGWLGSVEFEWIQVSIFSF